MQTIGRQPQRAPDGAPVHYERHRPEQTTLCRLVQQHVASSIAHTEARTGAELSRFIKDEFDTFLECGILAHAFMRLRCEECDHDKLLAFSCKRCGFCPSCGARRISQTAAQLVNHVIPHVRVRQWVLSLPIPLRLLLAAQPRLLTPVLQVTELCVRFNDTVWSVGNAQRCPRIVPVHAKASIALVMPLTGTHYTDPNAPDSSVRPLPRRSKRPLDEIDCRIT